MSLPTLLLIDGFNLLSRGYFATAYGKNEDELPTNDDGLYVNGLRVFFQKYFQLIDKHDITHTAVAWDVKREDSIRRQYCPTYKETRSDLPTPLIQQYESCTAILDTLKVKQLLVPPYEADDAIGAVSCMWSEQMEGPCYIYSNDKDLLQLLNQQTTQIIASKKEELLYTAERFRNDYGIEPTQWIDVKALLGDKSDNIPGCPGVGEKSALPLIQMYGSIEQVYEQLDSLDPQFKRYLKKLAAGHESVQLSKRLATIICDLPGLEQVNFDEFTHAFSEQLIKDSLEPFNIKVKIPQNQ